mgnify:FL=1
MGDMKEDVTCEYNRETVTAKKKDIVFSVSGPGKYDYFVVTDVLDTDSKYLSKYQLKKIEKSEEYKLGAEKILCQEILPMPDRFTQKTEPPTYYFFDPGDYGQKGHTEGDKMKEELGKVKVFVDSLTDGELEFVEDKSKKNERTSSHMFSANKSLIDLWGISLVKIREGLLKEKNMHDNHLLVQDELKVKMTECNKKVEKCNQKVEECERKLEECKTKLADAREEKSKVEGKCVALEGLKRKRKRNCDLFKQFSTQANCLAEELDLPNNPWEAGKQIMSSAF